MIRHTPRFGIGTIYFKTYTARDGDVCASIGDHTTDNEVQLDAAEARALHQWLTDALGLPARATDSRGDDNG